jgi:MFS transporter, UMF1 family
MQKPVDVVDVSVAPSGQTDAVESAGPSGRGVLRAGVARKEVLGWAMYDFANSGFTTVVITAVFAAYFVGAVAGGAAWGPLLWTSTLAVSYAIVMLTMPALGAWADVRAAKKRLLMWVTALCVLGTAALALVQPGDLVLACVLVVIANTAYSWGESTSYAFLPELATPKGMGRVSGWGWGLGYAGGMLTLGLCLAYVLQAQAKGEAAASFVPVTMLITAAVYGLAATTTFALLKERASPQPMAAQQSGLRASLAQLKRTWAQAQHFTDFKWLLACTACYQAGVAVAITLAAIYAEQVIGFEPSETMVLIFVLNIAAMLGALGFGYVQDALGHKRVLAITLLGWTATCFIAALSTDKASFWWAAGLAGVCMGSSQSCGRAMAGLFAPPQQLGEFYGLWSFATRLAAIVGPVMYGLITWALDGNQRVAIAATGLLFVAGLVLLKPIDVARGQAAAHSTHSA